MRLTRRIVVIVLMAYGVSPARAQMPRAEDGHLSLVSGNNLDSWIIEHQGADRVSASDGTLLVAERAGLVRTKRLRYGDFELHFDVRPLMPSARASLVLVGNEPFANRQGTGVALSLLGTALPANASIRNLQLTWLALNPAGFQSAFALGAEWQSYSIVRRSEAVGVSLNGKLIAAEGVSNNVDGWLGFRTFAGQIAVRNLRIRTTAFPSSGMRASPSLQSYRPGVNGVTVPKIIHEVKPRYTSEAMGAKVQGTVLVEAVVDTDGEIHEATVVRSLDPKYGLDEEALIAARRWKFAPGTLDGKSVPVLVTISLSFTLK
jgi:TonB family protein